MLNAVLLTHSSYSYLRNEEQSLREKKINNDIIGAGWVLFAGLSQQYFVGALGNVIYHLGTNFIEQTRDHSHRAMVNIFDRQIKYSITQDDTP